MIYYVTFLRFVAICLITNCHYHDIYPTNLFVHYAVLGNCLFFAVSGFCLYNIKETFLRWIFKRLVRIFPTIWIITVVYWALGYYNVHVNVRSLFWWFAYPTVYSFIGAYVALLIPFYCVVKCPYKESWIIDKFVLAMLVTGVAYFLTYLFIYDKTYYHINIVAEPMIRFLYFECMLSGVYFRRKDIYFRNRAPKLRYVLPLFFIMMLIYSSIVFMLKKGFITEQYQELSHVAVLGVVFLFLFLFASLDRWLNEVKTGKGTVINWALDKAVPFVSSLSLEIYFVQFFLIDLVRDKIKTFPLNWLILTSAILIAAFCLHWGSKPVNIFLLPLWGSKSKLRESSR